MLESNEYLELVEDLNMHVWLELYKDNKTINDRRSPFTYVTDGEETSICFLQEPVFFSGDFNFDEDDLFNSFPDQVINHIKKELKETLDEILVVLNKEINNE